MFVDALNEITCGKHKEQTLLYVAQHDPTYITWLLREVDEMHEYITEDIMKVYEYEIDLLRKSGYFDKPDYSHGYGGGHDDWMMECIPEEF